MFEKFITNVKKSLPESLKKKMGGDELDEDLEANSLNVDEEGDDASTSDEEEKKKKRTSMIIRVVLILGIAYFAIDEFVLKQDGGGTDQTVEEMLAKAPKRKRKPVPKPVETTEATATTDTAASTDATSTATTTTEGDTTSTASSEVPPIENVNVLDKGAETTTATDPITPAAEPETIISSTPVDTTPNVDQKLDQLIDNFDQTSSSASTETEEVKIPSQSPSETKKPSEQMASKIVDTAVQTAPPAYDQLGRGLVYNCKDKYWACLDKPAYVTCNKNMKWNDSKGNAKECVVQSIYNTDEDCAKVQKYNVSTNVATEFCK